MIQLVSDNFTRANENPLSDGGNWSIGPSAHAMQVLSDVATDTVGGFAGNQAIWTGSVVQIGGSWPADQYAEITIGSLLNSAFYDVYVRNSTTVKTGYDFELNVSGGHQILYVVVNGSQVTQYSFTSAILPGDIWRLSVTGSTLTVSRNGSVLLTQTDTNIPSGGVPGFGVEENTAGSGTATVSLFAAGANQAATPTFSPVAGSYSGPLVVTVSSSTPGGTIFYTTDGSTPTHSSSSVANGGTITLNASATIKAFVSVSDFADSTASSASYIVTAPSHYSVPDCRDYGNFPNDAVNVNGTLTYTTPSVDSRKAGPPVDSRAAGAPVACGTYPQNSRTPGTYGPGE